MRIDSIQVRRFRNLASLTWEPTAGLNLVCGANGQGKTNLLEAIHFALLGRSFRTRREEECLPWGAAGDGAEEVSLVEIALRRREGKETRRAVIGRAFKRLWRDGNLIERLADLWLASPVVIFTPADVDLFRGSPSERRRLLDLSLCQSSPAYLEALRRYQRALKQANAALKSRALSDAARRAEAEAFYPLLAESGAELTRARAAQMEALAAAAAPLFAELGGEGELGLQYLPSFKAAEGLAEQLALMHDDHVRMGAVALGPHRDDFRARLAARELAKFGSQGQNRLAALAFKLAMADRLERALNDPPILLFDDFGSELDAGRRRAVLERLRGRMQAFVTATEAADLGGEGLFDQARRLDAGQII